MSESEQYRAGFKAWAESRGLPLEGHGVGDYFYQETGAAWDAWIAAKSEASTEPSAWLHTLPGGTFSGGKAWQVIDNYEDARDEFEFFGGKLEPLYVGAGALPDEAKDAARLDYVLAYGRPMKWFDNDNRDVWRYTRINEWSSSPRDAIDAAIEAHKGGK